MPNDEVHVWQAALDLPASRVRCLRQLLAADELNRAAKFHAEQAQQRFIVGRGLLRTILGHYLDLEPGQIRFGYGEYGKPFLAAKHDQQALKFNVSHSDGLALYAITPGREVGIDLERVRTSFEYELIAERFFSPTEFAILCALPAEMKPEAFFNGWTRKEAYIKARGQGLTLPLDSFDVSLFPGAPARLMTIGGNTDEAVCWTLQALRPVPGYVGAIAVEGHGWQPKLLTMD